MAASVDDVVAGLFDALGDLLAGCLVALDADDALPSVGVDAGDTRERGDALLDDGFTAVAGHAGDFEFVIGHHAFRLVRGRRISGKIDGSPRRPTWATVTAIGGLAPRTDTRIHMGRGHLR